jgi:hypothetical protein
MSANLLSIKNYLSIAPIKTSVMPRNTKMTVKGWINRLVGCWHLDMSRPFSSQGQAYRVCMNCGAHRTFNLKNWETQGDFYYNKPTTKPFRVMSLAAVRRVAA